MLYKIEIGFKTGNKVKVLCKSFSCTLKSDSYEWKATGVKGIKPLSLNMTIDSVDYVISKRLTIFHLGWWTALFE